MNCTCGAIWCEVRNVCSFSGTSTPEGHMRLRGLLGSRAVPETGIDLGDGIMARWRSVRVSPIATSEQIRIYPMQRTWIDEVPRWSVGQ